MDIDLSLPDAAATLHLGEVLAAGITPGRVMHLRGELGAGKTTLVRGLLRGLGYRGRVKSPTYTLLEAYTLSRLNLYHFDFYRFVNRLEWRDSGFRDYFNADSACIVEWPERAGEALATPDLDLELRFADDARRIKIRARTPAGEAWLSSLQLCS